MTAHWLDSYSSERWSCIHKFSNLLNIQEIWSVKIYESYFGKVFVVLNHWHIKFFNTFEMSSDDHLFKKSESITQAMNWDDKQKLLKTIQFDGIFTLFQESKPIYHPENLKNFYLKGHINIVLKVLLKLSQILSINKTYVIPSWCELNLDELMSELTLE